jgi:MFS family permease
VRGCCAAARRAAARLRALFHPSLLRATICMLVVWLILSLAWYGLGVWLPTLYKSQDVTLSVYADAFISAAASVPGNAAASLLLDRVPRRQLLASTLAGAAACVLALALARGEAAIVGLASTNNAISALAWNAVNVLSTEAFPTATRSTAMGMLSASGRLGSIAGQLLFGFLVDDSSTTLLGIIAGLLLAATAAACALPASAVPGVAAAAPKAAAGGADADDDSRALLSPKAAAVASGALLPEAAAAGTGPPQLQLAATARVGEGAPLLARGHSLPHRGSADGAAVAVS